MLRKLVLYVLVFFVVFISVTATNYWVIKALNSEESYSSYYDESLKKGYLTQGELERLNKLQEELLTNPKQLQSRQSSYFKVLFSGFTLMAIVSYFTAPLLIKQSRLSYLLLTVAIASLVSTGSFIQSFFWSLSFLLPVLVRARKENTG